MGYLERAIDTFGPIFTSPASKVSRTRFTAQRRLPMHNTLPDYLGPNLDVVFVDINPGEWAVREGHYYANPRNKFWEFLHQSGMTCRQLKPEQGSRRKGLHYDAA